MFVIFAELLSIFDHFRMPNRKSYANADWMRMRFSRSLDKHGNCEVELMIKNYILPFQSWCICVLFWPSSWGLYTET